MQVLLIGLSISITLVTSIVLAKLSNEKHFFPLFFQLCLWCITGLALILCFVNCCVFYHNLKNQHQKKNEKQKAVKDFHKYYELLNPPELNT